MSADLVMWTVYGNPKDYPGKFVVRRGRVVQVPIVIPPRAPPLPIGTFVSVGIRTPILKPRLEMDDDPVCVAATLEGARDPLPPDLVRCERDPNDDPVIVEIWI